MPAGRPAGSVSKNKQALLLLLQKQYPDYHPVVELARIGNDPETDPSLAVQCHKEVAQYVTPKLKAVEMQVEGALDATIRWADGHSSILAETAPGKAT